MEKENSTAYFDTSQDILTIEHIRKLCLEGSYISKVHFDVQIASRGITLRDVAECISNGIIIESYPEDPRGPSCLIKGTSCTNSALHVVVGVSTENIIYITAYYPDPAKWDSTFSVRLRKE